VVRAFQGTAFELETGGGLGVDGCVWDDLMATRRWIGACCSARRNIAASAAAEAADDGVGADGGGTSRSARVRRALRERWRFIGLDIVSEQIDDFSLEVGVGELVQASITVVRRQFAKIEEDVGRLLMEVPVVHDSAPLFVTDFPVRAGARNERRSIRVRRCAWKGRERPRLVHRHAGEDAERGELGLCLAERTEPLESAVNRIEVDDGAVVSEDVLVEVEEERAFLSAATLVASRLRAWSMRTCLRMRAARASRWSRGRSGRPWLRMRRQASLTTAVAEGCGRTVRRRKSGSRCRGDRCRSAR